MTTDRAPPPFNGHDYIDPADQPHMEQPVAASQPPTAMHPIVSMQVGMNVTEDPETQHIIVMNAMIDNLSRSCGRASVLRVLNYLLDKHTEGGRS